ncbi:helix-turn-helix domain-containing protein [Cellulosimicrobium composti]|uniref:helix-turn-helix domain-containing protein n=1 Tax=Cellulosimicrobium composti TaxID=2672572 RepID=UPI0004665F95|nr:transcriptional regulator, AraC family [Cellulosimicrobium cellulans J34]SMF44104.1 transcriptional regulator, AraC family [Cellulosimicrobium cellulans J1]
MHEFVRARPGALPPGVVSMVGYRLRTAATDGTPPVHRGLPSPWLTLVVSTAGAVPTAVGPDEDPVRYASLVGGLHTRPAYIHQPPEQAGVQLALDPLACRDLLGVRAGELGLVEDADAVLGRVAERLRERVAEAGSWPAAFDVVRATLARDSSCARRDGVRPEVAEAWRVLVRTRGRARVRDVARHVTLGERRLETLFRAELGVSPRAARGLARFDAARRAVQRLALGRGPRTLADVAADAGYADHSHLVRDFRRFAGTTPTGWVREEVGNIQAGGHTDGPGWDHEHPREHPEHR